MKWGLGSSLRVPSTFPCCILCSQASPKGRGLLSTSYSCSIAQLCLTLCDPMDCSIPGSPVLHHLPEFAQTHVHWIGDAIRPSHPLSPPSPPALNLSQHQGIFQWVSSLHQAASTHPNYHSGFMGPLEGFCHSWRAFREGSTGLVCVWWPQASQKSRGRAGQRDSFPLGLEKPPGLALIDSDLRVLSCRQRRGWRLQNL